MTRSILNFHHSIPRAVLKRILDMLSRRFYPGRCDLALLGLRQLPAALFPQAVGAQSHLDGLVITDSPVVGIE